MREREAFGSIVCSRSLADIRRPEGAQVDAAIRQAEIAIRERQEVLNRKLPRTDPEVEKIRIEI